MSYRQSLMSSLARNRVVFAPDTETGSGGLGSDNNNNDNNNNNNNNDNNTQNNDDNFVDLWQADDNENDGNSNQNNNQNNNNQNNQNNETDTSTQFSDYLKSINFTDGVDFTELANDLQTGKTESVQAAIAKVGENAYSRALADATKVMDHKISDAVDRAVTAAGTNVNTNMAISSMEQRLNYTKDPALNPMAKAVLGQLMKKGKSLEDAITGVDKYFRRTSELMGKGKNPPRGRPGNQGFNNQGTHINNDSNQDDDGDEPDWSVLLGAS